MTNQTIRLVLSGYYGFDNSGDEAVLQSILLALEEQGKAAGLHVQPVVLSIDPAKTSRTYGVESVHRMQMKPLAATIRSADGLISGGGSLLQDATGMKTIPYYLSILKMAQWAGKPTFIYSQGIGPVYRSLFHAPIRHVFNKCTFISVRDEKSAELLLSYGVTLPVSIVPDPVMGLPLGQSRLQEATATDATPPVVGISLRYWRDDRAELRQLAAACRLLLEQSDVRLRFLPFHLPDDLTASRDVMTWLADGLDESTQEAYRARMSVADDAVHPQHMLQEVARCSVVIGMRLHALIYAASQRVPMVGISYDPKIDEFLRRIRQSPVGSTDALDSAKVADAAQQLIRNRYVWLDYAGDTIDKLQREAQMPAQRIVQYFLARQASMS